jgi:AraC-like DNA-binding protein
MRVTTREGIWIVPPARALWLPVGMLHEVRMEGDVEARTIYLDRPTSAPLGTRCKVVEVSRLLRELILAAVDAYEGRNARRLTILSPLLRHELRAARASGMCIQMPRDPRLTRACRRLLDDPSRTETLEQIAGRAGASSRTLARLFQRELKMTFRRWRQHLRLASALSQIAAGASIKSVAQDAGYRSCSAFSAMFRRALGVAPTHHLRGST